MAVLSFDHEKCNLCGQCIEACPFGALEIIQGRIEVNASCKSCKACIKKCPQNAISFIDEAREKVDTSQWKGILVYVEQDGSAIQPIALELIGEARKLANKIKHPVYSVLLGDVGIAQKAKTLIDHGVDKVYVYEHNELKNFRADVYTNIIEDCINTIKPSVVLVGATSLGRSLAPRLATRFRTGLTADCTELQMRENTDLVQIRPAFGGNIMAQIVSQNTRPQFATVRYKVMDRAEVVENPQGEVEQCTVKSEMLSSGINVLKTSAIDKHIGIEEAEVLVVGGRGVKNKKDLDYLVEFANALGGQIAVTRPLLEKGWAHYSQQIGLSGRTVKPKLIITCGVSGAIQFVAGMKSSECIIAINSDENAPIFKVANYCIVGDLYEVLPIMLEKLRKEAIANV